MRGGAGKNVAIWIIDFTMCWLALCGFANVVFGVASFRMDSLTQEFGPSQAPGEKYQRLAIYMAFSALGFAYMLWRNQWRFRLATAFYLIAFWCAIYAVAALMQSASSWLGIITFDALALLFFWYSICWTNARLRSDKLAARDNCSSSKN